MPSSLAGVIAEQQTVVTLLLGRALSSGQVTPAGIERLTRALFGHLRAFEDIVLPVLGDSKLADAAKVAGQTLADDLAIALSELQRSGSTALYEQMRGASARLFTAEARLLRDPNSIARIAAESDLAEAAEDQFASMMGSDLIEILARLKARTGDRRSIKRRAADRRSADRRLGILSLGTSRS